MIGTEKEYRRLWEQVEALMIKGERRSQEETALYRLLVALIERYEESTFPIESTPPNEMLKYLMEQRGLRQADLVPLFGSSGYVSGVVNGQRASSKILAKRLAEFFRVSPELFL